MSSSTLFYREIDVVPMLSREEEMELAVSQEEIRHRMLSALLSVSPARLRFTEPLRALARGRRVEREVVDPVHWSLRQGVLPEGRREELEELIPAVDASIDCATVRRLRPSWSWVEELGEETFASLDAFRELLDRADRIISGVGMGREELQEAAVRYASRLDTGAPERRAWEALPRLRGIERRLRLTELRTGVDSRTLFDAGRRYVEASSRHRELLEKLVEANLRLVVKWARRYCRTSALEEMDLVQEGCRGLLAAAMRYDYHRGYRFSTYAVWWVRRAILRALSQQSALIHLPSEAVDGRKRIAEAIQSWRESRGRVPTTAELSEELDIEPEQVRCLRDLMQDPVSFDLPMEDRDRVADYLEDRISPAERDAYEADVRKRIDSALENLTDRERTIISLRFGLYDGEPQTLEDVGRIFGVSRERIRQIESRSLDKLREYGVFFPADREDERG
jgi:RNA polymerase primary sigma factor